MRPCPRVSAACAALGLALAAAACSSSAPSPPARVTAGEATLDVAAGARTITLSRGGTTLLTLPADAFVVGTVDALADDQSYDPYWLEPEAPMHLAPPAGLRWRAATSATAIPSNPDEVTVMLGFEGGVTARLVLAAAAPGRFTARLTPDRAPAGMAVAFLRLRARAGATEAFYGLGDWADDVNQRGKLRPMQMELAPELESGDNEAHVPIPLLIGTRGWGLFVESTRVGVFDVARAEPDLVQVTYGTGAASADGLAFHLFAAAHPLDVTKLYYDVTGYPAVPAPWALGPWIWRDESRDQAQVEDDIAKIRDLDLATSAIWIDRPYATAVNTFDFNPAQFMDPAAMIATAHAQGLRVALWHTPYLASDAQPLLAEAEAAGYFPTTVGLLLNKWGKPLDLTNPAAYAFWQAHIRQYTDMGIEGFKLDYAEDVVPGLAGARNAWEFADGSDERTMHHGYQLLYHRVYAETLPETGGFLLCRAARWGDQRSVSVVWPGDMDATFTRHGEVFTGGDGNPVTGVGGLPATVIVGLNLGPSGFPFYGADTGGYRHSPPGKELYVRWLQQTALSTVMQIGDSSSEPVWEFTAANGRDQESVDIYRVYTRLHLRLFPYEWTYAQRLAQDGRPIQRALGLAFPELDAHPSDEYLFGDDLLVAPVMAAGAVARTVVLPPGAWIDWWDGTVYPGGATVEVAAPLATLPLLLRAGGIVPLLRPTIDTLAPATAAGIESYANDPGALWVRIARGAAPTAFDLFDGGRVAQDGATVSVTPGATFTAGPMLELVAETEPAGVDLDGAALARAATLAELEAAASGWAWDAAATGGTVWVKVPAGAHTATLR
ncbi:MAG TPA: TIM-barrel domain-containing protein [Polyangia bacterium]|jgi:alpha-D-xyloside xylohydrolase